MYNPFNKNISEIEYEDLKKLIENDVSEGWVIEYKGSFPKNKNIANSIASFANSEGGWYFIGIEEKENESNLTAGCEGQGQEGSAAGGLRRLRQKLHAAPENGH